MSACNRCTQTDSCQQLRGPIWKIKGLSCSDFCQILYKVKSYFTWAKSTAALGSSSSANDISNLLSHLAYWLWGCGIFYLFLPLCDVFPFGILWRCKIQNKVIFSVFTTFVLLKLNVRLQWFPKASPFLPSFSTFHPAPIDPFLICRLPWVTRWSVSCHGRQHQIKDAPWWPTLNRMPPED